MFLNKKDTIHRLGRLVQEAQQRVWLVSPYLSLEKLRDLTRAVKNALARKVSVSLVVRSPESGMKVSPGCVDALQEMVDGGLKLLVVPDLHAKIYISERHALVTSLNLLESSFNNSIEIGMWVPTSRPEIEQIREFFTLEIKPHMREVRPSDLVSRAPAPVQHHPELSVHIADPRPIAPKMVKRPKKPADIEMGFCIRCACPIPLDPDKPYCNDDFIVWSRYGNEHYEDKYCHQCGDEYPASKAKPLCDECY